MSDLPSWLAVAGPILVLVVLGVFLLVVRLFRLKPKEMPETDAARDEYFRSLVYTPRPKNAD